MSDLKPCPFCGRIPEIQEDSRWPRHGKYAGKRVDAFEVVCKNMGCVICGADNVYFLSAEEAAEAWNRRVNDEADRCGCVLETE